MAHASFDVDRFLSDTLRNLNGAGWAPPCNAYEDQDGFHIEAALPGLNRDDINIAFEDGLLTVRGERKGENQDANRQYFVQEMGWGAFSRSFRMPRNVDLENVSASYRDGILKLVLPKRAEAKPRRIEIR